ncbi:hypothetical protein [Streptomyces lincolnensis]|nr:hypothetical protein [Streptomyces lincolnensis]
MAPVSPRELLALLQVFALPRPRQTPIRHTPCTGGDGVADTRIAP